MIHLFTDFGWNGPYVGEMKAVLARELPDIAIIDLMHDAPAFNPRAGAYLLAALSRRFCQSELCLAVVDPGVGDDRRRVLLLEADGVRYVGPDNGLFAILAQRAKQCHCREVLWRPAALSHSFHGRDLFAPVVIHEVIGETQETASIEPEALVGMDWPKQLAEVIYIDGYGNAVTGLCAADCSKSAVYMFKNVEIGYAPTFSAVAEGSPFWYENSMGLVEIAANATSAAELLGLQIGSPAVPIA